MKLGTLTICATLLAVSATTQAHAQRRDTVSTDSTRLGRPVPLDSIVVTGARLPVTRAQLGFALTAISLNDPSTTPRAYASDVLRDVPGSFVDEAAGPGGPTIVRLRGGEEVFTQILVDGVQINQNGGFFDFLGLALNNLDGVEIARGPQSAVYGSSAVSGVVNFISRRGTPGRPDLDLQTVAGTHAGVQTSGLGGDLESGGTFRAAVNAGGGTDWLGYSVGLGHAYRRGQYQQPHNTRTRDVSVRLDATPSNRWELTSSTRFVGVESKLPVRDPGASRVPLDPNSLYERDRIVSSLTGTFMPSRIWRHRVSASVYRERFLYDDRRDDVDPMSMLGFFVFDADFALRSVLWRAAAEYVGTVVLEPDANFDVTLSYGTRWEREDLTDSTSGDFGDGSLGLARSSGAGFVELLFDAAPVSLLTGARIEKFEDLDAEVTPRVAAKIALLPGHLWLRSAVGRAYKAPNLQQQFLDNPFIASNPDLKAETSWSWDVGADFQTRNGRFFGAVSFFHQEFDNLIRTVAQEGSSQQINRNLGKSTARGLEWDLRYRPRERVAFGAYGSWIHTDIVDNSGLSDAAFPIDSVLPFRPRYQSALFVDLRVAGLLDVKLTSKVTGSQIVLTERFSGSRVRIDPYHLLSLDAVVHPSRTLDFYTRIDNVFNQNYQTAFDRRGIPLTVLFGARLRR